MASGGTGGFVCRWSLDISKQRRAREQACAEIPGSLQVGQAVAPVAGVWTFLNRDARVSKRVPKSLDRFRWDRRFRLSGARIQPAGLLPRAAESVPLRRA